MNEGELKERISANTFYQWGTGNIQSGTVNSESVKQFIDEAIQDFPKPLLLTVERNKTLGAYQEKNFDYEAIQKWRVKWLGEQK